eukprot:Opistho-2@78048
MDPLVAARIGCVPHAEEVEGDGAALGDRQIPRVIGRLVELRCDCAVTRVIGSESTRRARIKAADNSFTGSGHKGGGCGVPDADRLRGGGGITARVRRRPHAQQRPIARTRAGRHRDVQLDPCARACVNSSHGIHNGRSALEIGVGGDVGHDGGDRVPHRHALDSHGEVAAPVDGPPRAHKHVASRANNAFAIFLKGHLDVGRRVAVVSGGDDWRRGDGGAINSDVRWHADKNGRNGVAVERILVQTGFVAALVRRTVLTEHSVVERACALNARLCQSRYDISLHIITHRHVRQRCAARQGNHLTPAKHGRSFVADRHLLADVVEVAALVRRNPPARHCKRIGARTIRSALRICNVHICGACVRRLDSWNGRHAAYRDQVGQRGDIEVGRCVINNVDKPLHKRNVATIVHRLPGAPDAQALLAGHNRRFLLEFDRAHHGTTVVHRSDSRRRRNRRATRKEQVVGEVHKRWRRIVVHLHNALFLCRVVAHICRRPCAAKCVVRGTFDALFYRRILNNSVRIAIVGCANRGILRHRGVSAAKGCGSGNSSESRRRIIQHTNDLGGSFLVST